MIISGEHNFYEAPPILWKMLINPDILVRVTPGIISLESIGTDEYKAISKVNIGPVQGLFEGVLSLKDKIENTAITLSIDQKSKIGNVKAEIVINFEANGDNETIINYEGNAKFNGMLARMGQRIIGGVISTLSRQFFKSLEQVLELNHQQ